jgi:anti-sigma factor RsiW
LKENSGHLDCEDAQASIPALLDRELDGAVAANLVTHLTGCPACSEYAFHELTLHRKLAEELCDDADTDVLWQRISTAMDAHDWATTHHDKTRDEPNAPFRRHYMKLGIAASVTLLAGAIGFYAVSVHERPNLVTETVNDYITFRASGHKLHVNNHRPEVVKQWLEARIDFDIAVRTKLPKGFRLLGGRLCSFLGRRLAFMHFRKGDRSAALYVMSGDGLDAPSRNTKQLGDRKVTSTSTRGITNIFWRDAGLIYVLVSDLAETEAYGFVEKI